jgi:membrane protease subunit HflK
VREVIGASDLSSIMPDQLTQADVEAKTPPANPSAELATQSLKVLQATLDRYDSGLVVSQVSFQNVRPPQEVKEAFDDAISAREDRQRSSNQADAYAKAIIPQARGDAARILAESQGYKAERIAKAEGDGQRFNLIASEYKAAPEVTRKRLYIETMQKVLAETNKVIDLSSGKNLLYLPLDVNKTLPSPTVEALAPIVGATPDTTKGGR